MKIRVKEPESGIDMQLEVKLVEVEYKHQWLVTLPKGEIISFVLSGGKWLKQTDGKISEEFSVAIGNIMDLMSKHDGFGKDLDPFYIIRRSGNKKIYL